MTMLEDGLSVPDWSWVDHASIPRLSERGRILRRALAIQRPFLDDPLRINPLLKRDLIDRMKGIQQRVSSFKGRCPVKTLVETDRPGEGYLLKLRMDLPTSPHSRHAPLWSSELLVPELAEAWVSFHEGDEVADLEFGGGPWPAALKIWPGGVLSVVWERDGRSLRGTVWLMLPHPHTPWVQEALPLRPVSPEEDALNLDGEALWRLNGQGGALLERGTLDLWQHDSWSARWDLSRAEEGVKWRVLEAAQSSQNSAAALKELALRLGWEPVAQEGP